MTKSVILTGLRANNTLTLGNYFGGMLPMVAMARHHSNDYQINMFIPDLHSFTTPIDYSRLHDQILQTARLFVAAGLPLDNEGIHLYRQSHISAHSELAWILSCFTSFGQMKRMTQFKDKSVSGGMRDERSGDSDTETTSGDEVSVGLLNYPILMAADILLYNTTYVPVGDDQTQHLEFTRDIAQRINSRFGEVFTIPEPVSEQHKLFGNAKGLRIMDLVHPDKKMSKSDTSGKGVVYLEDEPKMAASKVMSATTDDRASVQFNRDEQPGVSNLLEILSLLRGKKLDETVAEFSGINRYGDFKAIVAGELETFLTNFQQRLSSVDDDAIARKLEASEHLLRDVANETLLRAQQVVGLRQRL